MRKIKFVLFLLLIIPVVIFATSFDNAKKSANTYHEKFLTPSRYLDVDRDLYYGLNNGAVNDVSGFTRGGFITEEEFNLTMITDKPSSSYLYDGTKFYTINNKVIWDKYPNTTSGDIKSKVTKYVKHKTKVTGNGKRSTPWMFVDEYSITVKKNGNGLIGSKHDRLEGNSTITQQTHPHGNTTFYIMPDSGYEYLSNDCGNKTQVKKMDGSEYDYELIFKGAEKDIECTVIFQERLLTKGGFILPVPYLNITTKKYNTRKHEMNAPANGFSSTPYPSEFYVLWKKGYYRDKTLTTKVGVITIPTRPGFTFDRYYVNSGSKPTLIDNKGIFETTYQLLTERDTSDKIGFEMHENDYTVTLNHGIGTGGTESVVAKFAHDMPLPGNQSLVLPKKPGYVFIGYYEKSQTDDPNNTSKMYYNGSGNIDSNCEPWDQPRSTTIYAHFRKCYKGNKCPTGNDETPCPVRQHQDEEGKTVCKDCPVGTANNKPGQVTCALCETGHYQDETAQLTCKECPEGKYQDEKGKTSCKTCAAGTYNNRKAQASCPCCPGGTYQGSPGQTYCNTCGAGTFSTGCASMCTQCEAGHYQPNPGQSSCPCCPAGKYQGSTGQSYCDTTPAGSYSGSCATTPTSCSPGTYQSSPGSSSCNNCSSGTYQNGSGAKSCNTCKAGYSSGSGATRCYQYYYIKYYDSRKYTVSGNCGCRQVGCAFGAGIFDGCVDNSGSCQIDGSTGSISCSCGAASNPTGNNSGCTTGYSSWANYGSTEETICEPDDHTLERTRCSSRKTRYDP